MTYSHPGQASPETKEHRGEGSGLRGRSTEQCINTDQVHLFDICNTISYKFTIQIQFTRYNNTDTNISTNTIQIQYNTIQLRKLYLKIPEKVKLVLGLLFS